MCAKYGIRDEEKRFSAHFNFDINPPKMFSGGYEVVPKIYCPYPIATGKC